MTTHGKLFSPQCGLCLCDPVWPFQAGQPHGTPTKYSNWETAVIAFQETKHELSHKSSDECSHVLLKLNGDKTFVPIWHFDSMSVMI